MLLSTFSSCVLLFCHHIVAERKYDICSDINKIHHQNWILSIYGLVVYLSILQSDTKPDMLINIVLQIRFTFSHILWGK